MITLEWNTGDDTPTTVTTTELTGSIAFQIEQWYEISSQNEVPRYRTESTFTVSDAVIKIPDEIFVTLILTAQGTGVTTSREFAYSVLKQLSDNGTVIKLDASEQGTRTSYDRVVIKRMSNIVRVNEEYFCKLVLSEIRTAVIDVSALVAKESTVVDADTSLTKTYRLTDTEELVLPFGAPALVEDPSSIGAAGGIVQPLLGVIDYFIDVFTVQQTER